MQRSEFVRPGLTITINSATIGSDGTITTTYTLTDPNGLGLDSAGVNTPGTISVSFVAATIPANAEQYTAYTTKTATGTIIAHYAATRRGFGRRDHRAGDHRAVSICVQDQSAHWFRCDRDTYHRNLRVS